MALGGLTAAVLSAAPANAWSTTDFDAGNIVDDVLFYDGDAITTAQVQSFLNDRVTRCSSGSTCLRDYTITTSSQAASSYCKAYAGAKNEKAAAIIAKVGKACGISQRVLLIMLQKEQSLVTDTSPSAQQYFRAMGYACPDSGPGGSANCDASQGGFYKQVYRAAWQLKVYKARPNDYRYRPFQKNTIQYSVPLNCGTSTVSIENWATAALYIYTPYRPNKAALAAGWGTGDGCSTYGNRNFFNFWNQWFGPVRAELQMTGAIKKVYDAAEAAGTPYGDPVAARQKITANGGGYQMVFEKGVITQSTALGKTFGLRDPSMFKAYVDLGGASSAWGFLASNPSGSKVADRDNRRLTLQNGTLVHSTVTAGVGIRFMPTAVAAPWLASGAQAGPFGFPNANAAMKTSVAGSQRFIGGTMMVSGSRSTLVSPTDAAKWQTLGGYDALGFYTADPVIIGDRSYRLSQKGAVFFLSATKQLFLADNAITRSYLAGKGPAGKLGWPTAGVRRHSSGGLSQRFENFAAVYAASTGIRSLSIPAYNDWLQRGAEKSALGYPNADTRRLSDGEYQRYPGYTVFYGPVRTSTLSNDLIVTDYLNRGGPASRWGWPST
ncbi:MAG: hypothetical protein J0H64_05100, partial [Actinobacteria bacterium]|nr:hypothetical protein [Actinomycetota bacterium]